MLERLEGFREILCGVRRSGGDLTAASKGREREQFIELFLAQVFPPHYRFGTGDILDRRERRSGQLDVVVEYPLLPSLPIPGTTAPRLYPADGVAAAIEVKSNVQDQWTEVTTTAKKLAPLERYYDDAMTMGTYEPEHRIPLFAVGYQGWKTKEAAARHLTPGKVDAILIIEPGVFVSSADFIFREAENSAEALWLFLTCLYKAMGSLQAASTDLDEYLKE